ncbi:MAG: SDR family oxidoreductase [Verrucomicrobiales bacterium]|nr:SDR family oxidoreductase [Verrucomicrobiales bacterium]
MDGGRILVTGATDYVGGRLVPELVARGHRVRVLLRTASPSAEERFAGAERSVGDALDPASLADALKGVDTVCYLIHSLVLRNARTEATALRAATGFREAAVRAGVKRLIYLGRQEDRDSSTSDRPSVLKALRSAAVPVTALWTAPIIGSGSALYEALKGLVRHSPVILVPRWSRHRCRPVAIRDVVQSLVSLIEHPVLSGGDPAIGGLDVLTQAELLQMLAGVLGRRRLLLPSPIQSPAFCAYWASWFTSVPAPILRTLFAAAAGGETVESSRELEQLLPAPPQGCKEALVRAMSREEQDRVATHWSDAYPPAHELAMKLDELPAPPRFRASDSRTTPKRAPALFASVCRIGGREGWCNTNWMWRMRGAIDRLFLGVGTARGRRCERTLQLHDAVDFWRVERLEKDARLLLRAEMKLPGKAWLEFRIEPEPAGGGNRLSVIAWFAPHGWAGWLYWWFFVPFHWLIFNDLVRGIEKRA